MQIFWWLSVNLTLRCNIDKILTKLSRIFIDQFASQRRHCWPRKLTWIFELIGRKASDQVGSHFLVLTHRIWQATRTFSEQRESQTMEFVLEDSFIFQFGDAALSLDNTRHRGERRLFLLHHAAPASKVIIFHKDANMTVCEILGGLKTGFLGSY